MGATVNMYNFDGLRAGVMPACPLDFRKRADVPMIEMAETTSTEIDHAVPLWVMIDPEATGLRSIWSHGAPARI